MNKNTYLLVSAMEKQFTIQLNEKYTCTLEVVQLMQQRTANNTTCNGLTAMHSTHV